MAAQLFLCVDLARFNTINSNYTVKWTPNIPDLADLAARLLLRTFVASPFSGFVTVHASRRRGVGDGGCEAGQVLIVTMFTAKIRKNAVK